MISIREAVESIVRSDIPAWQGLERGILNLSEYARAIQAPVAVYTKKEVGIQSIVVTLSRIEKRILKQARTKEVEIKQLAVQSPIVQLIYPKNPATLESLTKAIREMSKLDDIFFSFSTSTKDIALVISESLERELAAHFNTPPVIQKRNLSAISIRFDEKLVFEPNIGLKLLQKIASRNVVLDAALTTYNEFTLIFENKYLHDAIEALGMRKD